MGKLKQARRIARSARRVMNAGDGDGLLIVAPGPSAAVVAELTGAHIGEGTPEGAVIIQILVGSEDPTRVARSLAAYVQSDVDAVAVLAGSPEERESHERALLAEDLIAQSRIVHVNALDDANGETLRRHLAGALPADLAAVAERQPLMRPAITRNIIGRSSLYAALAAGLRKAGMPALTLIQLYMLADLAAGHGRRIGPKRAADVAAVIGAGAIWKFTGRASMRLLPAPAWAIRGGIAWAGTRVLGQVAGSRLSSDQDLVPVGPTDSPGQPVRSGGG